MSAEELLLHLILLLLLIVFVNISANIIIYLWDMI
jgi:hypothetical protein